MIHPAPERLVDDEGRLVRVGVFAGAAHRANLDELRLRLRGLVLPDVLARLRLKEWQHFALILPDLFVGVAIVNIGYMQTSWCHVVERATGRAFEHKRTGLALDLRVARELAGDRTHVAARGYRIEVENEAVSRHRVRIEIDAGRGRPAVRAALSCISPQEVSPLAVVMPAGSPEHPAYTVKLPLQLEGTLALGEREARITPGAAVALLDVHKAFYPRHTFWYWATFAGRDRLGRLIAANLTRNVNRDDAEVNENCIWCDGRIEHLGPARFELDRAHVLAPWRIRSEDGGAELTFTPRGERSENLRLGLVRSVFHQPHGTFAGTLRFAGETIPVDDLFGVCEDHDSLW